MAIVFHKVYRQTGPGEGLCVVMAPVVLPQARGVWFLRASLARPDSYLEGTVFEGADDKFVVLTASGQATFEPLTLDRLDEMKEAIGDYKMFRSRFKTDEALQEWYWDEFATEPSGQQIDHDEVYAHMLASLKA